VLVRFGEPVSPEAAPATIAGLTQFFEARVQGLLDQINAEHVSVASI
jgi:hypothetical protein